MDKIIRSSPIVGSRRISDRRDKSADKKNISEDKSVDISEHQNEDNSELQSYPQFESYSNQQILSADEIAKLNEEIARLKRTVASLEAKNIELQSDVKDFSEERSATTKENERLREVGYQEGYEKGSKVAFEESQAKISALEENVFTVVGLLKASAESQIVGLEEMSVEVALVALCRIIEGKLADKNFVISAVRTVLKNVKDQNSIVVRVNPDQIKTITGVRESFSEVMSGEKIKFVPDPRVVVGGCLLETESGSWDGRLETQVQKLIDFAKNPENQRSAN